MKRGFKVVTKYLDKGLNLPKRATRNAAGYDFECAEDFVLPSIWKKDFLKILRAVRKQKDYSDEELKKYIFGGDYVNLLYFRIFGQKDTKIPFIQKYDVETDWPDRLYVTVYEKAIVGYVRYMGCNMYFDKDGIVVESSTDLYENVPQIDGLKFDSIVINTKLDVGNADIYNTILDLIQSFDKYDIDVDKVYFDASYNITLYMGDVKVSLGSSKDFTDRLFELKQLSSRFGTLKGTLYLDDYNGDESSIIFKREK